MDNYYDSKIISVSDLTRNIKYLLEENFPSVWVKGEISNYKPHFSGHLYFTLKDADAQISCVIWKNRAANLPFEIKDGIKVHIFGNIRVYEKSGRYQLDSLSIQPAGLGELQIIFEQLKQKLFKEGMFEEKYKKPIPKYPSIIGIITSSTGAAIRDILSVLKRRAPSVEIIIYHVKVQGEGAALEIAHAIKTLNIYKKIDTIIMGRGGGSLEDLWPFNEEIVARAIFNSEIPIISAVGHEVDFTISDFVADLRAPTPSAAAELSVPDEKILMEYIVNLHSGMVAYVSDALTRLRNNLHNIYKSYAFRHPEDYIFQFSQKIDELANKMNMSFKYSIKTYRNTLRSLEKQLESLNPKNILDRGYSMLFKNGNIISSVECIDINDHVSIKLSDGSLQSKILGKSHEKTENI